MFSGLLQAVNISGWGASAIIICVVADSVGVHRLGRLPVITGGIIYISVLGLHRLYIIMPGLSRKDLYIYRWGIISEGVGLHQFPLLAVQAVVIAPGFYAVSASSAVGDCWRCRYLLGLLPGYYLGLFPGDVLGVVLSAGMISGRSRWFLRDDLNPVSVVSVVRLQTSAGFLSDFPAVSQGCRVCTPIDKFD